jgi:glutaredoxin-like protein
MSLTNADRAAINEALAAIVTPVTLIFFEQSIGCETCAPTRRLLHELTTLNERLTLQVLNLVLDKSQAEALGIDRVPAVIISVAGGHTRRFLGAPFGNEMMSLVEAIRLAGTGDSRLSDESRASLAGLSRPVDIKVFFTPTCVYCPRMVTLANQIATESPLVTATAIDATEYPDLVRRYNVNGVPKIVMNDADEILGAITEAELVGAVTKGVDGR